MHEINEIPQVHLFIKNFASSIIHNVSQAITIALLPCAYEIVPIQYDLKRVLIYFSWCFVFINSYCFTVLDKMQSIEFQSVAMLDFSIEQIVWNLEKKLTRYLIA